MIEFALRGRIGSPHYEPIGAWVQGPGPGIDLVIKFRPGYDKARKDAEKVIDQLAENGMLALPDEVYPRVCGGTRARSFLDDYEEGLSPRVRGNPGHALHSVLTCRSIPACAGEPCCPG